MAEHVSTVDGAVVLECSENPALEAILTIRTPRGDEYVINSDALSRAFAVFLSDVANEQRGGWDLGARWWQDEFHKLKASALPMECADQDKEKSNG